jgi:hypothetical protein
MNLPNLKERYLYHTCKILSTGKEIEFRGMVVGDDKNFLMMKNNATFKQLVTNIKNLLQDCVKTELDMNSLELIDLEWIFLKVRAESKGSENIIKMQCFNEIDDPENEGEKIECGGQIEYVLDTENISLPKLDKDVKRKYTIKTSGEDVILNMKPVYVSDLDFLDIEDENLLITSIALYIDSIEEGDVIFDEFTKEEIENFVQTIPKVTLDNIKENWIDKQAKIETKIELECPKCKYKETKDVDDFEIFF